GNPEWQPVDHSGRAAVLLRVAAVARMASADLDRGRREHRGVRLARGQVHGASWRHRPAMAGDAAAEPVYVRDRRAAGAALRGLASHPGRMRTLVVAGLYLCV